MHKFRTAILTFLVFNTFPLKATIASASPAAPRALEVRSTPEQVSAEAPGFSFPSGKSVVQVPFELLANAIYVSVHVNGRGPFLFAIDTGSWGSVFSSELAEELGMKQQGETRGMGAGSASNTMGLVHGKIEFVFPGGLKLSTQDANTVAMAGLWPLIGRRVYGDIGYDVLKDLVVQFDYEKKLVTFYSPSTYKYSGNGQAMDATLEMNHTLIGSLRNCRSEYIRGLIQLHGSQVQNKFATYLRYKDCEAAPRNLPNYGPKPS